MTAQQKKWIKHEGEAFKDDDEAQAAAEAWIAENEGYEFKGKHKVVKDETDESNLHSEYEVHKKQEPAQIENPAAVEKKEEPGNEGDKPKEEELKASVEGEAAQENKVEEEGK